MIRFFLACCVAAVCAAAPDVPEALARADQVAIHLYVFASKGCPECQALKGQIKRLPAELDCRIVLHEHWVDDLSEYKRLLAMERRYGRAAGGSLPVVFVGRHALGSDDLGERLSVLLAELAASGGAGELAVPTAEEAKEVLRGGALTGKLCLAYFERPGCRECARVEHVLEFAQAQCAGLTIRRFPTHAGRDRLLLEALCERAGIPEESRLVVPAVFVGDEGLVGDRITDEALQDLVSRHAGQGEKPAWEVPQDEIAQARSRLIKRLGKVGIFSVLVGGLVDSVNPCAFATLAFFIGYLATLGRRGRDVIVVGGAFTVGVFVAYFATGLGLSEVLFGLEAFPVAAECMTWGIIALTFTLAALSLHDFVQARRGKVDAVALKLPRPLRMRINRLITRRLRTRNVALAALSLGLVVSLLELACTGQVYFPLIRFMNSVAVGRGGGDLAADALQPGVRVSAGRHLRGGGPGAGVGAAERTAQAQRSPRQAPHSSLLLLAGNPADPFPLVSTGRGWSPA